MIFPPAVTDVAFADGKVARVGPGLQADADTDIRDVSGAIVKPGLIDLTLRLCRRGRRASDGRPQDRLGRRRDREAMVAPQTFEPTQDGVSRTLRWECAAPADLAASA
jgi:imidazolonepropionase-like amidohydrolase